MLRGIVSGLEYFLLWGRVTYAVHNDCEYPLDDVFSQRQLCSLNPYILLKGSAKIILVVDSHPTAVYFRVICVFNLSAL
jgi:hypothetical protein